MPIPNYLKDIAFNERKKGDFTAFDIKCNCGCSSFYAYESYLDKDEKKACEPHQKALEEVYRCNGSFKCTVDSDGTVHHYKLGPLYDITKKPVKEFIVPPAPFYSSVVVFKIKCSECGTEYTVFDTRYNGYSGKYCMNLSEQEKNYTPHFKQKKNRDNKPFPISVRVEHDPSFEEFQENVGAECSVTDYEDAFTWISVSSVSDNGKKRQLFEFESD